MGNAGGGMSVEQEGRLLVERLGGRWSPAGGMCRCPAHADRRPSLSVRPGRRRLLLHCFAGCDSSEILRALAAEGLLTPGGPRQSDGSGRARNVALRAAAARVWSSARALSGTMGEAYLRSRALSAVPDLRFHPRAPLGPRPLTRYGPALIAPVADAAGLVGVQRTFLERRGSRIIATGKLGLGPFGRGAVRLGGSAPRLGVAEGVETALSVSSLFGIPCWAALGTERFGLIDLPEGVEELILFLDNDAGGRRAEHLARQAFGHLALVVRYPPRAGADWNDVLRAKRHGPN